MLCDSDYENYLFKCADSMYKQKLAMVLAYEDSRGKIKLLVFQPVHDYLDIGQSQSYSLFRTSKNTFVESKVATTRQSRFVL